MREETSDLIERIDVDPSVGLQEVRDLWNHERDSVGADVEFIVGFGVDVDRMLRDIRDLEDWTVRFLGTDDDAYLRVALVYHGESPGGTLFTEDL